MLIPGRLVAFTAFETGQTLEQHTECCLEPDQRQPVADVADVAVNAGAERLRPLFVAIDVAVPRNDAPEVTFAAARSRSKYRSSSLGPRMYCRSAAPRWTLARSCNR